MITIACLSCLSVRHVLDASMPHLGSMSTKLDQWAMHHCLSGNYHHAIHHIITVPLTCLSRAEAFQFINAIHHSLLVTTNANQK
jgi:hypothetical protein